ncbi:MAG: hypothetical protein QHC67_00095 [Sphingobium sp.]|uniref:hypothetical protein n=1 Tax=Sphingobium sp. TaxID=1912891 RepID=UPI0029BD4D4C|nr:hypothetical protein [Sphingobium sp.]MDX3908208.1 hypothetical protein [Sphingobium sp.]
MIGHGGDFKSAFNFGAGVFALGTLAAETQEAGACTLRWIGSIGDKRPMLIIKALSAGVREPDSKSTALSSLKIIRLWVRHVGNKLCFDQSARFKC